jgi:hypothetical protein
MPPYFFRQREKVSFETGIRRQSSVTGVPASLLQADDLLLRPFRHPILPLLAPRGEGFQL